MTTLATWHAPAAGDTVVGASVSREIVWLDLATPSAWSPLAPPDRATGDNDELRLK